MNNIIAKYVKPFLISTAIGIIMSSVLVLIAWSGSVVEQPIMSWIYSLDIFAFFYPVFCSVPYCWLMYHERRNNYHFFVHNRIKMKKYFFYHWCCGSLSAFASLFIISVFGAVLSLCLTPIYQNERNIAAEYLFGTLLVNNPIVYAVGISIWRGIIGILMFTLGYILSLHSKHVFVILTGPLVYSVLENFCTAILGISNISLVAAFYPESINWSYFSFSPYLSILIGPLLLLIACGLIQSFYCIKGKKNDA